MLGVLGRQVHSSMPGARLTRTAETATNTALTPLANVKPRANPGQTPVKPVPPSPYTRAPTA
jgi:hypothetical protein